MTKGVMMQAERKTRAEGQEPAGAGEAVPVLISVPGWDITDEQIEEWKQSCSGVPGVRLAGYTAAAIRDGEYDNGRELYPRKWAAEVSRETIDRAMEMLRERGMVRKSGASWFPVVPGRMEPSLWRAVGTLLDRRAELPAELVAGLGSWLRGLHALNAPGGLAEQFAAGRTVQPARPNLAIAARR